MKTLTKNVILNMNHVYLKKKKKRIMLIVLLGQLLIIYLQNDRELKGA